MLKPSRPFILTLLAMTAFAGNSLLCRLALKETEIDAASFTLIRIASGALALWLILVVRNLRAGGGAMTVAFKAAGVPRWRSSPMRLRFRLRISVSPLEQAHYCSSALFR